MEEWRTLTTAKLQAYLQTLDDSTDHWEEVMRELDVRRSQGSMSSPGLGY